MFDANQILGVLMESGMARSGQSRVQRMTGGQGGGLADIAGALLGGGSGQGGGGLAGVAGALLGGGSRGGASGGGGGLGNIAGALLGGGQGGSGGGLGNIAGALLGGGRGAGGGSAMGILGTLAGVAIQQFASSQGGADPGLAEEPRPYDAADPADNNRALVMIRAMVSAAKADGEIDAQEHQRILGRLEEAGADAEAQAFVRDAMAAPADANAIVAEIDSPQAAVEAYTASLFAIDVDTPAEAAYMRQLAQGLRLDPALVRALHESLEAPQPQ